MNKKSHSGNIQGWEGNQNYKTKKRRVINAAFTPLHLQNNYVPESTESLPKVEATPEPEAKFEYTVEIACSEEDLQLSGIRMFTLGKTQNENSVTSWGQKLHRETAHVLFTCSVMENEPKTLNHSFIVGVNSALQVQDVMPSEKGKSVAKESFIPIKPAVQVGQLLGWPAEGFFYHFIEGKLIHEYRLLGKGSLAFQVTASTATQISDQLLFPHRQTAILLPWKRKGQVVARQHLLYSQEKISNQQLGEITLSWLDEHGCALDLEKIVAARSCPIMPREKEEESDAKNEASEPRTHVVAVKEDNSAIEWWSDIAPKYNLTPKELLGLNPSFSDDPMALKLGDVLSVISNKSPQNTMKKKSTLPPLNPPYTVAALIIAMLSYCNMAYAVHPQIKIDTKPNRTNDTLCLDKEDIYFNGQMENNKFVSLCGYQHTSPDSGYVKYRYGTLDNIELEFPKDNFPPKGRFLSNNMSGGSVSGHVLFFDISNYRYAIGAVAGNCTLGVYKNLEPIFSQSCRKTSRLNVLTGLSAGSLNKVISRFPEQFQYHAK